MSKQIIDPTMEIREDPIELPDYSVYGSDASDMLADYLKEYGGYLDYTEENITEDADSIFSLGDDGATGLSVTDDMGEFPSGQEIADDEEEAKRKQKEEEEDEKITSTKNTIQPSYPRGPRTTFPGLPNTSVGLGPIFAGGAALAISNNDDDETTVPLPLPGDDDMNDPTTTTTPTYTLDPMGRIIPSSMAEADPEAGTPQGTLRDLQDFFSVYGGADGLGGEFAKQMAGVTGAGQTAYAQEVLGMEGDDIGAFDIARETSSQQRGALGDVFGLGPDATYADITAAGTAPMQGLSQVRETVLPGLQSAFQESEQRLKQGLSGRQLQNVQQQARARYGDRLRDTAAFVGEVTDVASEDAGLFSRNLQDLLGIGQTTSNIGQQEAYAMSPFTQAAIGSADLGPGLALAGDIGRQAAAGTPSPTDIFGLEAGERQFSLNQQALEQMAEAGRLDILGQTLGTIASGFRGGPMAGLQTQYGTPPFMQQFQQGDQYRFPLGV